MAPHTPEANWGDAGTEHSDFTVEHPASEGDFDRTNYISKIKDYVRKAESFDLRNGESNEEVK